MVVSVCYVFECRYDNRLIGKPFKKVVEPEFSFSDIYSLFDSLYIVILDQFRNHDDTRENGVKSFSRNLDILLVLRI